VLLLKAGFEVVTLGHVCLGYGASQFCSTNFGGPATVRILNIVFVYPLHNVPHQKLLHDSKRGP
jgi:hypothetical protein